MRAGTTETAIRETLAAVRADLVAALAEIKLPPELVEATERLAASREARATAWTVHRGLIAERGKTVARDNAGDAAIHRAKAALDRIERAVMAAQGALNTQRQAHGDTIAAALARYLAAVQAAVEGAAQILADVAATAAAGHYELPPALAYTPELRILAEEASRTVAAGMRLKQSRADRAVSKAAAAERATAVPGEALRAPR
jgi:hypothetical protein